MAKSNKATHFIKRLQEDEQFRFDVGPELLRIQEGNWAAVVGVAAESGYSFTTKELLAVIPEGFFKGKGKNPERGWDKSTLKRGKTKTVK